MFKLSDIVKYLIDDIRLDIINQLSQVNIPDNTIDIANVVIFDNAASIINELLKLGYMLIDSKDMFRNELLLKNWDVNHASVTLKDVTEIPTEMDKIKQFIQELREDTVYNCCSPKLYPLIVLSQISRPSVMWTFSGDSWTGYGKYIAEKIYYKDGSPKLSIFIKAIKGSEKLYIVRNNSFVEFDNTFTLENDIAHVPYIESKWTWKELFYRATIIPAEFGKLKLVEKQPWKDALSSILRDCSPKIMHKISLDQFMRGVDNIGY